MPSWQTSFAMELWHCYGDVSQSDIAVEHVFLTFVFFSGADAGSAAAPGTPGAGLDS